MTEDPKWTDWMNYESREEQYIRMFQAEKDQLRIEEGHNCRHIHVRDKLVGAVDDETEVRLKLDPNISPALEFHRRGTNLFVFVYLHEWER